VNALPLQIKFTAASSSTLGGTLPASTVSPTVSTVYYTYFTMQNPSLSKFNPNGVVNGVYFAGTTTGVYTTGTTSSVVNVPGAAWNVAYTYTSSTIESQATSFTFSTYGTVAAILGSTTNVNNYFPQFSLSKLTTSAITTLNSLSSATIIIPQLNTYNSNVFALYITFPTTLLTTIGAGYPLVVNVPLQGFYTCPQYADVTFSY
jgi:hypothetical protein